MWKCQLYSAGDDDWGFQRNCHHRGITFKWRNWLTSINSHGSGGVFFLFFCPALSFFCRCHVTALNTGSWSFASMSSTSTVLILYYALPHLPHTPKTSYGAKNVESNNISSGDLHYLQVQLIREKKYFHRIFNITRSLIILFLWTLYLNSCYNCI